MGLGRALCTLGGNAGIGFVTVKALCTLGYHVILTARSIEKGNEAIAEIKKENPSAKVDALVMELKSLTSVRQCAQDFVASGTPLHLLINNAGIMNTPYEMTEDGIEAQFQVNHLGHFLFTHYMLPVMRQSGGGRVVNLSSRAHLRWNQPLDMSMVISETNDTYDGWSSYGRSKLCNILFSRMLAIKFPYDQSKISFNSLHPGLVATKLLNTAPGLSSSAISVDDGIKCSMYVATSTDIEGVSGKHFSESSIVDTPNNISSWAQSDEEAIKVWVKSLELTGLKDEEYGL
eukprot:gene13774-18473_t